MRPQVVIIATVVLNALLFVANLIIARLSNSDAVLAQAIYTITDLVGSALLLWGLYLSRLPADYLYPFGRGKERFFWAFASILVTFTTAGIIAIVAGFDQALAPKPISHIGFALAVVVVSLLVSIGGISITLRELRIGRQTLRALLESANQGLKSIFYQDLVTIAGCAVAVGGLTVVYRTGLDYVDGLTAILEGFLLVATGFVLTAESREYLIGRALDPGGRPGDPASRGARCPGRARAQPSIDDPGSRGCPPRPKDQLPGRAHDRPDRAYGRRGRAVAEGALPDAPAHRHRTGVLSAPSGRRRVSRYRRIVSTTRATAIEPKKR